MKRSAMLLGAGMLMLCSMLYAAVPQLINFQGILKDGSGNPVADGAYSVQFTIYDAPAGGNVKWTETQSVTTTDGLFSVLLGSVSPVPDSVFNDSSRWLGIQVGADPEMTPRQQMVSVPFALRVAHFIAGFGTANTFIGLNAGNLTMTGFNNTATGDSALQSNTTGFRNTAIGTSALLLNTAGAGNTASGYQALFGNTTGNSNTAIGSTALGSNATGNGNTASGASALLSNTTGSNNTASGRNALAFNTIGEENTANGLSALLFNTTGNYNTAIGASALQSNTTAFNNTASGYRALYSNTTGNNHTASGHQALFSNTTGNDNTAVGINALFGNTTGSNNTAIGYQANVSAGNLTNATAIGSGAVVDASNKIRLGNTAVTLVETDGNFKVGANDTIFSSNFSSNSPLSLQAPAGMVRMFINDVNGNIGIGTASPAARLDVDGGNIELDPSSSTTGNITKGGIRFIHNFGFSNTFIGENAGNLTMTGSLNTASGAGALLFNTTGGGNTASGASALLFNTTGVNNTAGGANALYSNTTGGGNTASGVGALRNNTTGNTNTACGVNALQSNTTGGNNTAIGFGADVSEGNLTNATAIGANATVNASNKIRLGNSAVTVIEGQVDFTFTSDRNQKENFRPVDGEEVLRKLQGLPLSSWNYKGHDPKQFRHYGPMAQDFFAAFGNDGIGKIGTETTLNSGDVAGILMIAVQALGNENAELKTRIEQLEKQVNKLQAEKPKAEVR